MCKSNYSHDQFDQIVRGRIHADDFGQPQVADLDYYKRIASSQISGAIKAILNATNQHEFTTAIVQANSFITAASDYDFIDSAEKANWLNQVANAMRAQRIGESA